MRKPLAPRWERGCSLHRGGKPSAFHDLTENEGDSLGGLSDLSRATLAIGHLLFADRCGRSGLFSEHLSTLGLAGSKRGLPISQGRTEHDLGAIIRLRHLRFDLKLLFRDGTPIAAVLAISLRNCRADSSEMRYGCGGDTNGYRKYRRAPDSFRCNPSPLFLQVSAAASSSTAAGACHIRSVATPNSPNPTKNASRPGHSIGRSRRS